MSVFVVPTFLRCLSMSIDVYRGGDRGPGFGFRLLGKQNGYKIQLLYLKMPVLSGGISPTPNELDFTICSRDTIFVDSQELNPSSVAIWTVLISVEPTLLSTLACYLLGISS